MPTIYIRYVTQAELPKNAPANKEITGSFAPHGINGVSIAVALAEGAALQGLFLVILGAAGAYSSWCIQAAGAGILLRNWRKLIPIGILSGIWLILSLAAGAFQLGLWMVLGSTVFGLLLAWGGRRTDFGRQSLSQIFGLYRINR